MRSNSFAPQFHGARHLLSYCCAAFFFACGAIFLLGPSAIAAADWQAFYDDFDGGQVVTSPASGGFSGFVNIESSQGFAGLGTGGNVVSGDFLHNPTGDNYTNTPVEKTTLTLTGLPAHTGIDLNFLLAIIDTWDGTLGDFFHVDVDGASVFSEEFANGWPPEYQTYAPPTGVTIARNQSLGMEGYASSLYDMGLDDASFGNIVHTSSTLQIDFYAGGPDWNRPANESWAFDNVQVILHGVTIPEPSAFALAAVGGLAMFFMYRSRRRARMTTLI